MSGRQPAAPVLVLALALCLGLPANAGEAEGRAARDPFSPVALRAELAAPAARAGSAGVGPGASGARTVAVPSGPETWGVTLRGVMVDGRASLANVEGVLLALGQTLEEHRLVAVREGEAEFIHNGHTVVLRLPATEQGRKP